MSWLGGAAGGETGGGEKLVAFNPASTPQTATLATEEGEVLAVRVPPLGIRVLDPARAPVPDDRDAVRVEGERTLGNSFLEATIDDAGRIGMLRRADGGTLANGLGEDGSPLPMNQLVVYEDRPRRWEAWDTDRDYQEIATRVMSAAARIAVTKRGPVLSEITVERPVGAASRLVQRYRLQAGSPRLDVVTEVEWREDQRLLRALFPCDVRARRATFGIQFGHVERATHDNTSWERAQFEVPGHSWMDLSQPGLGVAVLDDGKFGRSAKHGTLGLSLLKSPNFPDPTADRGLHRFTYSVMVHHGCWRAAGVDAQAEQLNHPLVGAMARGGAGAIVDGWQAVDVRASGAAHLEVAALKPAEAAGGVALRLVEVRGGAGEVTVRWGFPVADAHAADLFERPMEIDGFAHDADARTTSFRVRPFQIVTVRAELPGAGA